MTEHQKQPQPIEYIITKEDYDQIYSIEYPLTLEERRRICERSHPHSGASETTPEDNGVFTLPLPVKTGQFLSKEDIQRIRTEARADERAKVLDALNDHINSKQLFSSGCDGHKMWIWVEPLEKLIISLRQQEQQR